MDKQAPVILVIDDELQMRRLLKITLEGSGFKIIEAENGQIGLLEAAQRKPDAIILDLGLPNMGGLEVLKKLREWSSIPVLILSVKDQENIKVEALDSGADDYVTKPFGQEELLARLRVMLRRTVEKLDNPIFENSGLSIDFTQRKIYLNGGELKLTLTEYSLLKYLAQHADKVLTHRQILHEIWGAGTEERTQYLRVYVTHLRQKIEADPNNPKRIKTESGIGYRFCLL